MNFKSAKQHWSTKAFSGRSCAVLTSTLERLKHGWPKAWHSYDHMIIMGARGAVEHLKSWGPQLPSSCEPLSLSKPWFPKRLALLTKLSASLKLAIDQQVANDSAQFHASKAHHQRSQWTRAKWLTQELLSWIMTSSYWLLMAHPAGEWWIRRRSQPFFTIKIIIFSHLPNMNQYTNYHALNHNYYIHLFNYKIL